MDPLAHTLFGAALAEAGVKRVARGATVALLIGANLPDIDVVAHLWGTDAALHARRGWTHGVLAMALLPWLLAALLHGWQRWRDRHAPPGHARPRRFARLLAVCCLAVWSHPLLDWLNTYGVRLLMPFDGRWFYGDTLYIVDPWVWLMLAAGVVLARSRRWPARGGWMLLAAAASWLVVSRSPSTGVLLAWGLGLATIAVMCCNGSRLASSTVARAGIAAVLGYSAVVFGAARQAEAAAAVRFPGADVVQAGPVAAMPFRQRLLLAYPDRYRIVMPDGTVRELARAPLDAVVRRALADPSIRGFSGWTRFPWWQTEPHPDGLRVRFHDLRYSEPGDRGGIGYAEVVVPIAGDN